MSLLAWGGRSSLIVCAIYGTDAVSGLTGSVKRRLMGLKI